MATWWQTGMSNWSSWVGADVPGFEGINPQRLIGLADTADQYRHRIALARHNTVGVLFRYGFGEATGIDWRLTAVEGALLRRADDLRWRARAIESAQLGGVNRLDLSGAIGLDGFAATAVFNIETWKEEYRHWRIEQLIRALQSMDPGERARAFAGMSAPDAAALVLNHPEVMGSMDGAPPTLRYTANRILIGIEIDYLEGYRDRLAENGAGTDHWVLAPLGERIDEYRRWLAEGRQILLFDPSGDGRVVEVFGDLDGAGRIAVVVPGMANDIGNFSEADGGFRADARDLYETISSAAMSKDDVATVAWLGYDSPDNIGATMRNAAEAGAPALQRFLEGVDPGRERAVTVIAHSYGSVLAGVAAGSGLDANDLVFVGSPGTTLESAGDAVLRTDGRVWSALAENDPIALGINPSEYPWWVPPPFTLPWLGADVWNDGAEELWHGTNPANDQFGARRITTDGSSGHSSYFESGSLENLARIVAGLYSEVELVDPPPGSGAW